MLQTIRDHTQGWLAGTIISILILTFAMWGIHAYFIGGTPGSVVAKVNGVEITKEKFTLTYEQARRQLQAQMGSSSPVTGKLETGLKERVLNELISSEVLKQASQNEDYLISSSQIDNYLESIPEFQKNGQFSMGRFQEVMASSLYTANELIELIKTTLLIDQPKLGIVLTSISLPDETNYTISLVNQERGIQYLNLSSASLPSKNTPIISDEQISAYYKAHEDEFKTPEQVSVDYIELSLKDVMSTLHPSEEALKNFYNENINSYTQPSQKGHQVQPFEAVKDKVLEAVTRQQAEVKLASLRDQLADLTYEHPDSLQPAVKALGLSIKTSDMFTREKGGKDLSSNKKVREVAFSNEVLSLQNNSDVIQINPETMVVLRLKSHMPPALLPLNTVSKQIQDRLMAEQIKNQVSQLADDIYQKLQNGSQEAVVASQFNLSWSQPGFIGRYSKNVDSAILEKAFQLSRPQNGKSSYGVVQLPNGYAVIAVYAVRDGTVKDQKQYALFSEQIQSSEGLLEYTLYKQSLMNKAKITIEKQ